MSGLTTPAQREILDRLEVPLPPRILELATHPSN